MAPLPPSIKEFWLLYDTKQQVSRTVLIPPLEFWISPLVAMEFETLCTWKFIPLSVKFNN
jgi:hypothetical protein